MAMHTVHIAYPFDICATSCCIRAPHLEYMDSTGQCLVHTCSIYLSPSCLFCSSTKGTAHRCRGRTSSCIQSVLLGSIPLDLLFGYWGRPGHACNLHACFFFLFLISHVALALASWYITLDFYITPASYPSAHRIASTHPISCVPPFTLLSWHTRLLSLLYKILHLHLLSVSKTM